MGKFGEGGLGVNSSKDAFQKVFDVNNTPDVTDIGDGSAPVDPPVDPTADPTAGAAKEGLSTTSKILIGSIVGVVVIVGIIALIIWWNCRKAGASEPPESDSGTVEKKLPGSGLGIGGIVPPAKSEKSKNKMTIEEAGEFTQESATALQGVLDEFLGGADTFDVDELEKFDISKLTKDNVKINGEPVGDDSLLPASICNFVRVLWDINMSPEVRAAVIKTQRITFDGEINPQDHQLG